MLDEELAIRDGEDHAFYAPFNKVVNLQHVIIAYAVNEPVACGALRVLDEESMEIKRMYTRPEYRGKGIAKKILSALENQAFTAGYKQCVLETGLHQPEAIALYERTGYERIENYGPYAGVYNSVCFKKSSQIT